MEKLNIHYFQHVTYEGLGTIEEWVSQTGHVLTVTKLYESINFPHITEIDWLIILGGPMNVQDEELYPWLKVEKEYIREVINSGKTVLGICLGSQLISEVLGARVYPNVEKEIGWYDIEFTSFAEEGDLFFDMGHYLKVFHWHGDTFDLPENAISLASSKATNNQAYIYNRKVLAMQFHIETTMNSIQQMLGNCINDLTPGNYIQTEEEILKSEEFALSNRKIQFALLDRLAKQV